MTHPSIETATPETLLAYCAVQAPGDPEAFTRIQARLNEGTLDWSQLLLLRSARGVEGAALLPRTPAPLFPHLRSDALPDAALALYRHLHAWAARQTPPPHLIVQDDFAPPAPNLLAQAGWQLCSHDVIYRTDLHAHPHAPDPAATEGPLAALLGAPFASFYAPIHALAPDVRDQPMREVLEGHARRPGGVLVTISDGHELVGAATVACVRGPAEPTASIAMLGVTPAARGRGWGRRLHAHALAVAAREAKLHMGATASANIAMRRILEANGGQLLHTQAQYQP